MSHNRIVAGDSVWPLAFLSMYLNDHLLSDSTVKALIDLYEALKKNPKDAKELKIYGNLKANVADAISDLEPEFEQAS